MKAPKNYYNVVDQKKLGLDQIDKNAAAIAQLQDLPVLPTPGEGDEGKVPKVNAEGVYMLAADEALPEVTAADNGKIIAVDNGAWTPTSVINQYSLVARGFSTIGSYKLHRLLISCSSQNYTMMNILVPDSALRNYSPVQGMPITIINNDVRYVGFLINFDAKTSTSTMEFIAYVSDGVKAYIAKVVNFTLTLTEVGTTQYIDVMISGSDVTLPTGYDYTSIKALVDAGVDVKLKDNNGVVYSLEYNDRDLDFTATSHSGDKIGVAKIVLQSDDTYTFTSTSATAIKYINITISGSSASLPSGTTYLDIKSDLDNGINIKLVDGADIYTIAEYDNVDLKAYTFDMGLTELYAKEIQLHSDGTGSYTMMTISGTT